MLDQCTYRHVHACSCCITRGCPVDIHGVCSSQLNEKVLLRRANHNCPWQLPSMHASWFTRMYYCIYSLKERCQVVQDEAVVADGLVMLHIRCRIEVPFKCIPFVLCYWLQDCHCWSSLFGNFGLWAAVFVEHGSVSRFLTKLEASCGGGWRWICFLSCPLHTRSWLVADCKRSAEQRHYYSIFYDTDTIVTCMFQDFPKRSLHKLHHPSLWGSLHPYNQLHLIAYASAYNYLHACRSHMTHCPGSYYLWTMPFTLKLWAMSIPVWTIVLQQMPSWLLSEDERIKGRHERHWLNEWITFPTTWMLGFIASMQHVIIAVAMFVQDVWWQRNNKGCIR